ncbi:MAG TPA: hypothetical protein P5218_10970, partial [Planctomycetota bacterium]|nr:hypothetical protein [Planctomycetota bacterium]
LGIPYAVRALPGCAEARVRWPHLPDAVTPALQALQDGLEACHASWQWFGTHAMAGTFGPAPAPGLAWAQESLRRQFDPQGRFQPRPRA